MSTSTINSVPLDNLAPAMIKNFSYKKMVNGNIIFNWDKNKEIDLSGYVFEIVNPIDKSVVEIIDLSKDLTTYTLELSGHPKMTTGIDYRYQLTAKDLNNNVSQKSEVETVEFAKKVAVKKVISNVESQSNKKGRQLNTWYIITSVVALALIGGGIYFWKFRKPKKVKHKTKKF